jgi:tetratricopeptide (TPR) repeat protein
MLEIIKLTLIKIHSWLGIKNNLAIAGFYLLVASTVFGGFWSIFTHFYHTSTDKTSSNSNNIAGNTFNKSTVKIEQNITSGYTIEQHEKSLKDREASLRKDLEQAHDADKKLILLQLATAEEKRMNIQKSYEDTKAENKKLNLALNELKSKNPQIAVQQFVDAQSALQKGDNSIADKVFKDIENAAEESIVNAANAAYQRARIANNSFRWKDALELASKANRLQPKNEVYLSFYADMLLYTGDSLQAQKLYEQSLQLNNEKYGANSLEAAYQHNRLAQAYANSDFTKAEFHNKEAIRIAKSQNPIDNLFLGNLHSNIAGLYQKNGNFSEAESKHLLAITTHKKALPTSYPDLSIDYNNLAGLYRLQDKFNEAEKYYREAIDIDEKVLPVGHPSLSGHYDNLAQIYMLKGSSPIDKPTLLKAKKLLLDATKLLEKYPPPIESNVGSTYLNLAWTYSFLGDFKAAEPYFEKATDIAFKNFGANDDKTKMALQGYKICLEKQNKNYGQVLKKYGKLSSN